jgi:hypothetical protein
MEEIDRLAKTSGNIKPELWWRYRDDIIDVWKQGLSKLLANLLILSTLCILQLRLS